MAREIIKYLAVIIFAAITQTAIGAGGISAPDPYTLMRVVAPPVNEDTKATSYRTPQALNPAVRNLIIIAFGQSNITNAAPSAYTPANGSKIDCLNIYDGNSYVAADPQLGTTLSFIGHPIFRLADNLITANLFDRVVIVPAAVAGTEVSDWDTGVASRNIPVTFARLASRGLVTGTNVTIIVLWGQGETDTLVATSQASYTASLTNVIAQSRTAGFSGLWFIAQQSYISGATSAAVVAAQAAAVNHGTNIWAGPNADALVGNNCSGSACRQGDNTHWSDLGSAAYASGWQTALHAFGAPF